MMTLGTYNFMRCFKFHKVLFWSCCNNLLLHRIFFKKCY